MKRAGDIIFIIFFSGLLFVPIFIDVFGIKVDTENSEKRAIKEAPHFTLDHAHASSGPWKIFQGFNEDISSYKTSFDEYYKDNFKLKNHLFDLYVDVKMDVLGNNPIPQNVIKGNDGWLFLGNSYCDVVLEYSGLKLFSKEEMSKIKTFIKDNDSWLKSKNISFYVAVAPDKQSIYGKYLPLEVNGKTKFKQLKEANQDHSYNLIDLSETFAQTSIRLFHKTDTHWNEFGAFLGYRTLMHYLKQSYPDLTILNQNDFKIDTVITYQKDLSEMLRRKIKEDQIVLNYGIPEYAEERVSLLTVPKDYIGDPAKYEKRYVNHKRKLKILMFRDSFSDAWIKFFKESFGECIFIKGHNLDKTLIQNENPDIVIYEIVERDIDILLPAPLGT
jgi:alginate O-acetyltransferase complex protein AlgJ